MVSGRTLGFWRYKRKQWERRREYLGSQDYAHVVWDVNPDDEILGELQNSRYDRTYLQSEKERMGGTLVERCPIPTAPDVLIPSTAYERGEPWASGSLFC